MFWARMVAYVTVTVNQELQLRNEYLGAENRILRGQIKGRLLLSGGEKSTLTEIAQRLGRKALEELAAVAKPDTLPDSRYTKLFLGQIGAWITRAQNRKSILNFRAGGRDVPR